MDALPTTLSMEEGEKLPAVHVGEGFINRCFGSVDSLRALQESIDKNLVPHSFPLRGMHVHLQTSTAIRELSTQNVVGMIEGSDPGLRNEVVVIGAHYDHLGVKRNAPAGTDSIYNGADDNGSGTVALMEVGTALGAMHGKPLRTILLIAFAGEEKGLFGSEYYARKPLFPLDSTVAMLNMDMVGRNAEDSLQIIGSPEGSFLVNTTRKEDLNVGFTLVNTALEPGGSDHESFEKRNVPVLFYHSGLHPDYHQVSDEAQRISETKIARVANLVFRTAWQAANAHDPLIHPSSRGNK
jgi:Zn-dependent M28 family amino/carboxypeptidase